MDIELNGNLIIIGGAEDKKGRKKILDKVCNCINKERDILLVVTVATLYPKEAAEKYRNVFTNLGVRNIEVLNINSREDSYKDESIELIKKSRLIFFTGGDQLRITSLIGGTPVCEELKKSGVNGKYIVGTSAGASVMSDTMIVDGDDEESPRKCTLKMSPGMGFIENVIIDQHFAQRGRIGRLLTGIAQNPDVLGIGIDENTAIIVNKNGFFEVIGEGAVYIIDGSTISYSNVSEQYSDEILSIYNVKLHVLREKDKFSLARRTPFEEDKLKDEDNKTNSI
ncbi:MAG: cyanophycinase [Clostridium sp.]|uniref:cyanophycinase n=1 Tax=Clostridium sp. DSM 8431 TaxID=1761781 RepID=UPI0008F3CC55|nr:cyanophycinase [Clostridium sp. DSM 8431]MCR4945116.1 cyanophycinase [Clostridium sp.]SFU77640.1 cyanophycinase [Clostridium sp. DSM 8431]